MLQAHVRFQIHLPWPTKHSSLSLCLSYVAICRRVFTLDRRAFKNLDTNWKVTWRSSPRAWFISRSQVKFLWRLWLHMHIDFLTKMCSIEVRNVGATILEKWLTMSGKNQALRAYSCVIRDVLQTKFHYPLNNLSQVALSTPSICPHMTVTMKKWQNLRWRRHSLKRKTTPKLPLGVIYGVASYSSWS